MKRCLSCDAKYILDDTKCPLCGEKVVIIDGFESYAPEYAYEGGGFKSESFSHLAKLEDGSFWFKSRNNLILWALGEYFSGFSTLLEVGCGTGYVLSAIKKTYPQSILFGSEIFSSGLAYAASRIPSVRLMQMDARNIPFVDEFDVIGAFDVLEHILEDEAALKQMFDALKPHGYIFVTVPQHDWLWSVTDDYAIHVRRYSAMDIHKKIETAGFQRVRSTSFMTILLPVMLISRLLKKRVTVEQFDPTSELRINPILNGIFTFLLNIERQFIEWGVDFPIGGSRFIVAQKV